MHNQHGIVKSWLIFFIIFLGLATAFLIWWFVIRDTGEIRQEVTTYTLETEPEVDDGAPVGYVWYRSQDPQLEFVHPGNWNLYIREFGNAQNIEEADIALTASDFDLSYFGSQKKARVILELAGELFCQETDNLKRWKAYVGDDDPVAATDKRCQEPELLLINDYLSPAFSDESKTTYRYGIFLPFKGGGGMVFSDTVPIPKDSTGSEIEVIKADMKEVLRDRVTSFINENSQLLPKKQPRT